MDCSMPGFPVLHYVPKFTQTHVHWVGDVILWHPLSLLPSIFPSIRVFSNKSVLHITWSKYWSFTSSISPSNEYSGLISFRMDWLDLLAVQGPLKSLLQHHSSKAWVISFFLFFWQHHMACQILVLPPGIEPLPLSVEAQVLTAGLPGKSWIICFFYPIMCLSFFGI